MDISNLSGILQSLYATQGIGSNHWGNSAYFGNYMQSALLQMGNVFSAGDEVVVFKEEALQNMKENPEYAKYVIQMLKEKFTEEIPYDTSSTKCQVIGSNEKECYEVKVPNTRNHSGLYGLQNPLSVYGLYGNGMSSLGLGLYGIDNGYGTGYTSMINAYKNTPNTRRELTSSRLFGRKWSV